MTENIIVIALIVAILCAASFYVIKAKKKGQRCIGCLNAKSCNGNCR